jgi:hypothetical protein
LVFMRREAGVQLEGLPQGAVAHALYGAEISLGADS